MKERPILFSGPRVKAILAGKKTQTRRLSRLDAANADPDRWRVWGKPIGPHWTFTDHPLQGEKGALIHLNCPYGETGDRLWVKESYRIASSFAEDCPVAILTQEDIYYRADDDFTPGYRWRPSIFMPRHLSRISLEIQAIRLERLQAISEADCCAELGAPALWPGPGEEPYQRDVRGCFASAWNEINGKRQPWAANPWVWALTFGKVP